MSNEPGTELQRADAKHRHMLMSTKDIGWLQRHRLDIENRALVSLLIVVISVLSLAYWVGMAVRAIAQSTDIGTIGICCFFGVVCVVFGFGGYRYSRFLAKELHDTEDAIASFADDHGEVLGGVSLVDPDATAGDLAMVAPDEARGGLTDAKDA